jgi:cell division protein FtsL
MIITTLIVMVLVLSILINIFLYKALSVQLKKIKTYEQLVVDSDEWIESVRNAIRVTYIHMKNLDDKNIFIKDDEVGVVFSELLNLLKRLNDRIEQ